MVFFLSWVGERAVFTVCPLPLPVCSIYQYYGYSSCQYLQVVVSIGHYFSLFICIQLSLSSYLSLVAFSIDQYLLSVPGLLCFCIRQFLVIVSMDHYFSSKCYIFQLLVLVVVSSRLSSLFCISLEISISFQYFNISCQHFISSCQKLLKF